MEKLALLVHGKAITDQGGEDNVGSEHRLLFKSERSPDVDRNACRLHVGIRRHGALG